MVVVGFCDNSYNDTVASNRVLSSHDCNADI